MNISKAVKEAIRTYAQAEGLLTLAQDAVDRAQITCAEARGVVHTAYEHLVRIRDAEQAEKHGPN